MDMKVKRREGRCVEGKGVKLSFWRPCFPHPPSFDVCVVQKIYVQAMKSNNKKKSEEENRDRRG